LHFELGITETRLFEVFIRP